MKKYILITKSKTSIEYEIFTSYYRLLNVVKMRKSCFDNALILKWYRLDNLTLNKINNLENTLYQFIYESEVA